VLAPLSLYTVSVQRTLSVLLLVRDVSP